MNHAYKAKFPSSMFIKCEIVSRPHYMAQGKKSTSRLKDSSHGINSITLTQPSHINIMVRKICSMKLIIRH